LEGRVNDIHRLCDEGELEHAVVMLLRFLNENPYAREELLDELHAFAKRLSLSPTGQRLLGLVVNPDGVGRFHREDDDRRPKPKPFRRFGSE
jgi:hypothetical protein